MNLSVGASLRLVVVLLLAVFFAPRAEAGATATCPYYAINSSNGYKCFKTLAEAEDFIRAPAADGTHQNRRYLEQTISEPQQTVAGQEIYIHYGVKPRPGVEGPQGYKSLLIPNGNSAYELCGCTVTGGNAWCVPYGSQSNSTNTPALATYGHYCNSLGTLQSGMIAYRASLACRQDVDVPVKTQWSATPTGFTSSPPDNKPIYPANTGTLSYGGGVLRIQGADCNGNPVGGDRELRVASPLTCPVGWTLNPGSPPKASEACTSNEWGKILQYKPPVCPTGKCPKGGRYGNPVIAANGIKIQAPTGWNAESMLGLTLSYNSGLTDSTKGHFGGNWASLLSTRIAGVSYTPYGWAYSDAEGLIDIFWSTTGGVYRSINSTGAYMTRTSTECTVFEPSGRRMVFACVNGQTNRKLLRIEFPENPIKNLTVLWSTTEAFANGVQTEFNNVPNALVQADGRRIDIFYQRINTFADCETTAKPWTCGAIRVKAIHDASGNITLFDYNADGRLAKIYYPDDTREIFEYGAAADICPATMPACTSAIPASMPPSLLTGTYTETPDGNGGYTAPVRYGIYQYDSVGRAVVTTHPLDAGRTEFRYASDGTPTVRMYTDATHFVDRKITSTRVALYDKPKTITEYDPSGAVIRSSTNTYDAVGYLATSTDFRGTRTDYTFNSTTGLMTQMVEAANDTTGNKRTTQIDWDTAGRLITEVRLYDSTAAVPGTLVSRSSYKYNARGQQTEACQIDPHNAGAMAYVCGSANNAPTGVRQSRFVYCEQADVTADICPVVGELLSIDGARTDMTDVTTLAYFASDAEGCATDPAQCSHHLGDLWKSTNAAGQSVEIVGYDGAGRVLSLKDANGVVTDLEYSPRGWLSATKVRGVNAATEADDAITRFEYGVSGELVQVTRPDGTTLELGYDAARRLSEIRDALGNKIQYTLNMGGRHTQEQTQDSAGALKRGLSQLFDHLGRVQSVIDGNNAATTLAYDVGGNLDTSTDPLDRITDRDFDSLNRLRQIIANTTGSASDRATTQVGYDTLDRVTSVVDPKGLTTSYGFNGLGDETQVASPDTGTTTFAYDNGGLLTSKTDARGVSTLYSYDALGRVTLEDVPTAGQDVTFTYDVPPSDCTANEQYGKGRLASMTDESGSTRYCYDRRGNLSRKVQTVTQGTTLRTGITYDGAGNVVAMTYPSGAIVTYVRNANGQVTRVDAKPTSTAAQVTLVSDMTYMPFGPLRSIKFGNNRTQWRSYDQNYGIDAMNDGVPADGLFMDYQLNAVGNITAVNERTSMYRTYEYDGLDRLTAEKNGATNVESFTYDATGNRQSKTIGTSTAAYTYEANSHRLTNVAGQGARTYDAAGNAVTIRNYSLPHDDRSRLREFHVGGVHHQSYVYNGKGERVLRIGIQTPAITYQFVYDEAGHLLGEYSATGGRVAEYVWVGDLLVGVLKSHNGTTYQYVETDALGTPRAVINPVTNTTIWRWDLTPTAFGDHSANNDPDANGVGYGFNLRYPGQYYNGLDFISYNYYRDYDARTGRYVQSDPIGQEGGLGTYVYVAGRPLNATDASGLAPKSPYAVDIQQMLTTPRSGPVIPRNRLGEDDLVCVDLRCYQGNTPGMCKAEDGWMRVEDPRGTPTMGQVNQMEGCDCFDVRPRRNYEPDPDWISNAIEKADFLRAIKDKGQQLSQEARRVLSPQAQTQTYSPPPNRLGNRVVK